MKLKHCVFVTALTALVCAGLPASGDVPFGPYHLPEDALGPPLTLTMAGPKTPEEALRFLKAAREKKTKVLIHLTGGRERHQNADKSFNVEKFSALLERFQGVDFEPFVKDGTLLGHMLFDEPHDPTNWNGQPVPFTQIEAVAAVSKRLWPSLPTGIGSPPRYLSGGAPWKSLDFASAQYHAKRGDFENWLREEVALAKKAHLKLVLSLNVLHGGDTRRRDQPMSAEQLERYGTLCVQEPTAMALLMWKWDAAYFAQPKIRQALQTIANAASERLPQLQPSSTPASPAAKIENFQLTGERWTCTADGKPLIGLLLKPEGRGPFPAIVLSHARGVRVENAVRSKGRDFVKWGFVGIATDYTHKGGTTDPGFTFGARPENIRRALACLEIVRQQEDVDPRRIAAYGHSMGAFVTIALAAAAPDKIAAAAITAGGVHPQAVRPSPTPDVAEKVRAPFLILHGAADKVVSPKDSELFKQVLDKNKVPNERHLFEGVSHNLPGERADEVNHLIREWFTKHGVLAKAPPANLPREMPANQK